MSVDMQSCITVRYAQYVIPVSLGQIRPVSGIFMLEASLGLCLLLVCVSVLIDIRFCSDGFLGRPFMREIPCLIRA